MSNDVVLIVATIPSKEYEKRTKKEKLSIENEKDEKVNNKYIEEVLEDALNECGYSEVVWMPTRNQNFYKVYFEAKLIDTDLTLKYLNDKGIGSDSETSVGFIPFHLFYCGDTDTVKDESNPEIETSNSTFKKIQQNFLKSVTSRITAAEVVEGVRSGSVLTFDFVCYTIFAGCIASAGLLNNSAVDIAAAMMIEPVMGTVMAITFGMVVNDVPLRNLGIRSCIVSLLICIFVGYFYGIIAFIWKDQWHPPNGFWPTGEMSVRGELRTLWYGALQALASGGAIAVTLLNDNKAALVGVAVASTFLPPFINAGILWAYATHIHLNGLHQESISFNHSNHVYTLKEAWLPTENYEPKYMMDMRLESISLGLVSIIYTFVNVICMILMSYLILRIKEILPLGSMEPNKRFFRKDIKVTREYNKRSSLSSKDSITKQIIEEWANLAGLDPNRLLSDEPESAMTRLHTLQDIFDEVGADTTYQTVTKNAIGRPKGNFMRRMSQVSAQNPASRIPTTTNGLPSLVVVDETGQTINKTRSSTLNSSKRSKKSETRIPRKISSGQLSWTLNQRRVSLFPRLSSQDVDRSIWPSTTKDSRFSVTRKSLS